MNWLFFIVFIITVSIIDYVFNSSNSLLIEFFIFFCAYYLLQLFTIRTEHITIKSKHTKKTKLFKHKQYIIKTTDRRIFYNINDEIMLKFNAKKIQAIIKVGCSYEIKTYKISFFGERNILSVKEIKPSKTGTKKSK